MIEQTQPPLSDGWHWARRGNRFEMVLAGRQYAGKVWNPVARQQFDVGVYDGWWRVVEPKTELTRKAQ